MALYLALCHSLPRIDARILLTQFYSTESALWKNNIFSPLIFLILLPPLAVLCFLLVNFVWTECRCAAPLKCFWCDCNNRLQVIQPVWSCIYSFAVTEATGSVALLLHTQVIVPDFLCHNCILDNPTGFPGSLPGNHVCYCLFALCKSGFHIFLARFQPKNVFFEAESTQTKGN